MDRKIKLLVVPSDSQGVGHFRSIWPHQYIQEHYGDEFDVDIIFMHDFPRENLPDFFKQYDLIQFHKQFDSSMQILNMINFLGIPTVIDLDDNFKLTPSHPLYLSYKNEHWGEKIIKHVKAATYVTTTTPIYANELKKINPNVVILPNAIDEKEEQFSTKKTPSDRIRFGLVCGSTHRKDIELMGGIDILPPEIKNKMSITLSGFDTRGTTRIYNKQTGESTTRPIKPEESVWCRYEEFLTHNYRDVSQEHAQFLKTYAQGVDDPFKDDYYQRFWTRDIQHYGTHYEHVDVLLAPLEGNDFTRMKSQLKFIECGFTNTAIIASDFGPYQIDSVPYLEKNMKVNPNGNCLLVDPSKNHKQWGKYIKYLVEHPEAIDIIKTNLRRDMLKKYSMEVVAKDRVALYKKIVEEHDAKNNNVAIS